EPASLVHDRIHDLAHVVALVGLRRDEFGERLAARAWILRVAGGGLLARTLRHVSDVRPTELDRLLVVRDQGVAAAAFGAVHPSAAKRLEVYFLADHDLDHARRPEVHRGVALDHHHHVAESRDVGATGRGWSEQKTDLRHNPG